MPESPPANRTIFFFADGRADGGNDVKHLIGGKGASLAEMTRAGLNVPPGFTISAECCQQFHEADGQLASGLQEVIGDAVTRLEALAKRKFGRGDEPMLLAVRSGAAESMPGMMDTILNVGLNPGCVRAMADRSGDDRIAWQAYRDFLVTFGETVGRLEQKVFNRIVVGMLEEFDLKSEEELDAKQMEMLCERFRTTYQRHCGREFPTDPHEMVLQAIETVFHSWNSPRAVEYRKHNNIEGLIGTAVNVQIMCPSEVSGVLFTEHPVHPDAKQMVIESCFGLGELVVLGKVTPDQFVIDKQTGAVIDRRISDKRDIVKTSALNLTDSLAGGDRASLSDEQIRGLIALGGRVEEYFQMPCDIEWGLAAGEFYLLQARRIKWGKRSEAEEVERLRQEEIAKLRDLADPGGTVWSRYNLSEILPEPTPMTWSIVRQFMSGEGGFGQMHRDLGFDPASELDDAGIYDLICGRPYCNLSREPKMQFPELPFEHPFDKLKENPGAALHPVSRFNIAGAGWRFWLLIPYLFVKLFISAMRVRRIARIFPQQYSDAIAPSFLEEIGKEERVDLQSLDAAALLERLQHWIKRTLYDFARDSLKPTALAAMAMGNLERALARLSASASDPNRIPGREPPYHESVEAARNQIRKLVIGVCPAEEEDLAGALRNLQRGKVSAEWFLQHFGHRGPDEMELSTQRCAEDSHRFMQKVSARQVISNDRDPPAAAGHLDAEESASPFAVYNLPKVQEQALEKELESARTFLQLRETAKHHLMRGYFLIRKILVELDRRYQLEGGVFFLELDELADLLGGKDFSAVITERRQRRELLLKLAAPPVLFSDDLDAIGREVEGVAAESMQGIPLSAGVAEGPALVLHEPPETLPDEKAYILVCPSTDPAWLPLFVHARAIVMETGGMLSHGAIVAREFGLPAVAGLPDVHRRLKNGQRLQVDGSTGKVNVLE